MVRRNSVEQATPNGGGDVERKWLSLAEGATYTSFSEKTLRRYVATGRIKAYRAWQNGDIRFLRTDLDALFQ